MNRSTFRRAIYEELVAREPVGARLWVALGTRPSPPTVIQRTRWILAALERYNAHPTTSNLRKYVDSLRRHLGEEAARSYFEKLAEERGGGDSPHGDQ